MSGSDAATQDKVSSKFSFFNSSSTAQTPHLLCLSGTFARWVPCPSRVLCGRAVLSRSASLYPVWTICLS